MTDTGRVGGGVLAADIAILKLESGSRLIIMKTVWEMLLIDQFPPPRPALGLGSATTADSEKMSAPKVSTRPGWGPGYSIHTAELRQHDACSCEHPTSTSAALSCDAVKADQTADPAN